MAMQLNCNGLLKDSRAKKISRASCKNRKKWGSQLSSREKKGRTLTGSLHRYFLQETISTKEFLTMTCSQFGAPHICLNQPKLGSIMHSIAYHGLICGSWGYVCELGLKFWVDIEISSSWRHLCPGEACSQYVCELLYSWRNRVDRHCRSSASPSSWLVRLRFRL